MLATVVLSLLMSSAWAGEFTPVEVDDPSFEVVKNVITKANYYFEDHLITELRLPNIGGYLPFEVTLTDGKIGQLNTLALQEKPEILMRQNSDGSSTYLFDVRLGLRKLAVQYQFNTKFIWFTIRKGTVELSTEKNSAVASGMVVVKKDGQCFAGLHKVNFDKFQEFNVYIEPEDIPGLSIISRTIVNFITPRVIPITNKAISGILTLSFQNSFTQFVCKEIHHPTEAPSTKKPTRHTTTEATEETWPDTTEPPTTESDEETSPNTTEPSTTEYDEEEWPYVPKNHP